MSLEQKIEILNNEKIPQVYKAGQKSMVDESKVIEKTVSGTGFVNIDDVSEIPHKVEVQLSSDTITDFSDVSLTACGKNLYNLEAAYATGETKFTVVDNVVTIHAGSSTYGISITGNNGLISGNTYTFNFKVTGSATEQMFRVFYADGTSKDIFIKSNPTLTIPKGKQVKRVAIYVCWGTVIEQDIIISDIQIESGAVATPFEPYKSTTYTPNADGTVNVKSISPIMNIFTNEININISANYHKSYGMQTEYDNFWDTYQNYGERTDYGNAFAGEGWTVENLKPKYNIIPTSTYMMFRASRLKIDLVEYLKDLGITLDFSSAVNLQYVFGNSYFTHIGVFDTRKSTNTTVLDNTFSNSPYLVTIDKIILKPNATKQFGNTFTFCASLENIAFEGEINRDGLNLQWSTKLSKESITSVINALSTTTTGLTVTLSKTAVNNAFGINLDDVTTYPEGSEYYTLRHSKDNWTISYV